MRIEALRSGDGHQLRLAQAEDGIERINTGLLVGRSWFAAS
jgi:hypothetical protein